MEVTEENRNLHGKCEASIFWASTYISAGSCLARNIVLWLLHIHEEMLQEEQEDILFFDILILLWGPWAMLHILWLEFFSSVQL